MSIKNKEKNLRGICIQKEFFTCDLYFLNKSEEETFPRSANLKIKINLSIKNMKKFLRVICSFFVKSGNYHLKMKKKMSNINKKKFLRVICTFLNKNEDEIFSFQIKKKFVT